MKDGQGSREFFIWRRHRLRTYASSLCRAITSILRCSNTSKLRCASMSVLCPDAPLSCPDACSRCWTSDATGPQPRQSPPVETKCRYALAVLVLPPIYAPKVAHAPALLRSCLQTAASHDAKRDGVQLTHHWPRGIAGLELDTAQKLQCLTCARTANRLNPARILPC